MGSAIDRRSHVSLVKSLSSILVAGLLVAVSLHVFSPTSIRLSEVREATSRIINLQSGSKVAAKVSTFEVYGEDKSFLGNRKDPQTIVDATNIIESCHGQGEEGWRDTSNCVRYLRYHEEEYLSLDHDAPTCDEEHVVKYHTYWRGPLTWRVSLMLKSFIYTQNIECSQMHIWLDADYDAEAIERTLASAVLKPFLPLLDRGIIHLRAWTYPSVVYIPPEYQEDEFPEDNSLRFRHHQIPRGAVAVSDSVRFVVLHQEGGLYVDMDTMFLKDLRPLLITPKLAFAERWGAHPGDGEYNTAYLRLQANSSLSSRILQGAARMGMNFHPRVIGRMLAKTIEYENDLVMFETGVFDPIWSFFDRDNIGRCTVPCLSSFAKLYHRQPIPREWSELQPEDVLQKAPQQGNVMPTATNRTMSNFFRGSYILHIHNQWHKKVVPGSWIWVADQTYNQFFRGERPNPYGEYWHDKIDFSAEEADYRP